MPNTPDPPPLPRIIDNPPPLPIQLGQNAEDLETNFPVWMPFLCMLATCFGIMCYRVASEDYQVNKSTNSSNTFDQVASKKANVTTRYWGGLLKQSAEVLKKHSDSDLDESVLEEWAGKIQTLPINGVDADLVNHAMDFVTLLNERALLIRQWKQVLAGTEQHMTHISSPDALVESFLRGMSGDPAGKALEMIAQRKELESAGNQLLTMQQEWLKRFRAHIAGEVRLRAKLSEKYGTDFPPWLTL